MSSLSKEAQKVQNTLDKFGINLEVVELPDSTRSAEDAAQAIGCKIGQISKSLIFVTVDNGNPILVVASGPNRVDEIRVGKIVGQRIKLASPEFVLQQTGFPVGGVPPVGHKEKILTYIDRDLVQFDEIWAAAGTSHAVFRLAPQDLIRITEGNVIEVS